MTPAVQRRCSACDDPGIRGRLVVLFRPGVTAVVRCDGCLERAQRVSPAWAHAALPRDVPGPVAGTTPAASDSGPGPLSGSIEQEFVSQAARASCSCGWQGPQQPKLEPALTDLEVHYRRMHS